MRALVKLAALLAVLLLPFGMAPAAAAATHHPMAAMPMPHCPEQDSQHRSKAAFAECTMACSAALPALDRCLAQPLQVTGQRILPALARHLSDLHPDIATPPPRLS